MQISQKILTRLQTDKQFKFGLQKALNIVHESGLRYRIKNNTKLDEPEAIEYYKANGFTFEEIINRR